MKKYFLNILVTANIIALSLIIIALIVLSNSEIGSNNQWVGFFGNTVGGVITLTGVVITLRIQHKENQLVLLKSNEPHLLVKEVRHEKNDLLHGFITFGDKDFSPTELSEESDLYFDLVNVGSGPAYKICVSEVVREHSGIKYSDEYDFEKCGVIDRLSAGQSGRILIAGAKSLEQFKGVIVFKITYTDMLDSIGYSTEINLFIQDQEIKFLPIA